MNKKIIPAEASFFVPVEKVLFDHSRMRRSLETAAAENYPALTEDIMWDYTLFTFEKKKWALISITDRSTYGEECIRHSSRPNSEYVLYSYGEPVGMTNDSGTSYFGTDILGSVRSVTDKYGAVQADYSYDAFGSPYLGNLENDIGFGYCGKVYDIGTGLYDYGFRDYSPVSARFTTVDPIRDGSNWFSYVVNDPVNYVDIFGLCTSDRGFMSGQTLGYAASWTAQVIASSMLELGVVSSAGLSIVSSIINSQNTAQNNSGLLSSNATVLQNSNVDYYSVMTAASQYNYDYNSVAAVMRGEDPRKLSARSNAELNEMFATEMRKFVGLPYRSENETEGVDCSNSVTLALNNMTGLNLVNKKAADMASGKCPFITPLATTNKAIQGDAGILNFYIWEEAKGIEHVNAGVGQRDGEPTKQVVDATEGDWMIDPGKNRIGNPNQVITPKAHAVNQTYAPYLNSHDPDAQAVINWDYIRELLKAEGR